MLAATEGEEGRGWRGRRGGGGEGEEEEEKEEEAEPSCRTEGEEEPRRAPPYSALDHLFGSLVALIDLGPASPFRRSSPAAEEGGGGRFWEREGTNSSVVPVVRREEEYCWSLDLLEGSMRRCEGAFGVEGVGRRGGVRVCGRVFLGRKREEGMRKMKREYEEKKIGCCWRGEAEEGE